MPILRKLTLLSVTALLLGACGGDDDGNDAGDSTTSEETSRTPSPSAETPCAREGGAGQYLGATSENLCVRITRDQSGAITAFEIGIMTTCTLGFGESGVVLSTDLETLESSEAAFDPGDPFEATVAMIQVPIAVDASGAFQSGNLAGTIGDTGADGSYELDFTTQLIDELTCTGGSVTWTATAP